VIIVPCTSTGSVAAAATGGHLGITSLNEFYATHPFIILISEHTTGALLFMGRVCSVHGGGDPVVITSGLHCNDDMSRSGSGQ